MSQLDKAAKQLRRTFFYSLTIFVVTAAVVLSAARLLLPEVHGYKENIEQTIATLIEQNIKIEDIDARLVGLTPTIVLKNVRLIDDSGVREIISFREARIGIAVVQSIRQGTLVPADFTILGTSISVLQTRSGRFFLQGFGLPELDTSKGLDSKIGDELASWLLERSRISIKESTLLWKDKDSKEWHRFEDVNIVIHNKEQRHQLSGSFRLPDRAGQYSRIVLDVEGNLLDPMEWQGEVYLNSKRMRLSQLGIQPEVKNLKLIDGVADFELWGKWQEGSFRQIAGDVAITGVDIKNTQTGNTAHIDQLKSKFDWQGMQTDWQLKVSHLLFVSQGSIWTDATVVASMKKSTDGATEFGLGLSYAKIEDVRQLLLKSGLYTGEETQMLAGLEPVGEVRDLEVYYIKTADNEPRYRLSANVEGLGITAWRKIPGLYGVNGRVSLSDDVGEIELSGNNIVLTLPKLFRQSFVINELHSKLIAYNSGNGWIVQSEEARLKNNDVSMNLDMVLMLPKKAKSSYLDLQVAMQDLDLSRVKKYQPTTLMKEKLVTWIDNSIKSGKATELNVAYRGWSHKFPFRDESGVLNGDFAARDAKLDYFPGWPGLEGMRATGEFTQRYLKVSSNKATLHNGAVKNLSVLVDSFLRPILTVKGDAYSTTHDGFHFFAKTPIGQRAERFVNQTRFGGNIHTNLTFSMALDKDLAKEYKKRFSGFVESENAELIMSHERLDVTNIKGRIHFSEQKYFAEDITAKVMEGDARVNVSSRIVGIKPVMEISGEGDFDAVMLDRRFKQVGMMRVSGRIPWKGKLTLSYQKADSEEREPARMRLESDLLGTGIDLPEPFRKSPETTRHSSMRFTFLPEIKTILNVQYGDRMSTEMRLNNKYFPARIEIGEMKLSAGKAKLPDKDEFRLSGVVNDMDQYGWREVMQEHYDKYRKLRTRPIVEVPVMVDLAYVNVPFDKEKAKPRKRYTSPLVLPAFKGQVRRFVFAGQEVGKIEFDSRRDRFGLAFDRIHVSAPKMDYEGKLTWHYINDWHQTRAKGRLKTANLGAVMKRLGFEGKVENGEGELNLDLSWDNPFYIVKPAYLDGTIKLSLEDGIITAIDPGAGRFLGLLNISNLPRRLLLDFDDVGSGFGFDKLSGTITLKDGVATNKDLAVESTVANILAVGWVDLRNKELDQVVTVTPQVMGTMPVVSGLLMGTGVIPVVWLFERLFGRDIDKSISRQYLVKGPWEQARLERIDKEKGAQE